MGSRQILGGFGHSSDGSRFRGDRISLEEAIGLAWKLPLRCCCSVAKLCPTLCNPIDCSLPGAPFLHYLLEFAQIHVHRVGDAVQPPHLLLFPSPLPSIFPDITILSSELTLRIRWPKYWSFSFSISPSNEYSGLIFFRIDWFDLPAVQEFSPAPQFEGINSLVLSFLYGPALTSVHNYWKNHSFDYMAFVGKAMSLLLNMMLGLS